MKYEHIKKKIGGFVVFIFLFSVIMMSSAFASRSDNALDNLPYKRENRAGQNISENIVSEEGLNPNEVGVEVSENNAVETARKWLRGFCGRTLPERVETALLRPEYNLVVWRIEWKIFEGDNNLAMVDVNARSGKIVSFYLWDTPDRKTVKVSEEEALESARNLLDNFQVDMDRLSPPEVSLEGAGGYSGMEIKYYSVDWQQKVENISVICGWISVSVDPVTGKPTSYTNLLVDTENLVLNPTVSKTEAVEVAKKAVESDRVWNATEVEEIKEVELVVERPNRFWTDLGRVEEPRLIWLVKMCTNYYEYPGDHWDTEVMVDARKGVAVGGDQGCGGEFPSDTDQADSSQLWMIFAGGTLVAGATVAFILKRWRTNLL